MTITSSAINGNEYILDKYTCAGDNVNPPLTFSEVPSEAKSLVLIMDDPDAPGGTFTHWVLFNMSPATLQITESNLPISAVQGLNSFGKASYGGPCPPTGKPHHYYFKLYALDNVLDLQNGAETYSVTSALEGHVIEQCQIIGLYERK